LIERLNKNDISSSLIYSRVLSSNVDIAKIWLDKPKILDSVTNGDGPDTFYLIKNSDNIFVAVVFDMIRDLHWFVHPDFRGNGYLTHALKSIIIPHLFLSRDEQRITIKEIEIGEINFAASEKVALKSGFKSHGGGEYLLIKNNSISESYTTGENSSMSYERVDVLKRHINYLSRSLWAIQTELEMKFGESEYTNKLKDLKTQIRNHTWKLEDFYWETKNKELL